MFIVNNYPLAVALCIVTMLCWGSWSNTQKLTAKTWPFQLFYWDYSLGLILFSLFAGLSFGSIGSSGQSFLDNLSQAGTSYLLSAFLGGIIFNLANILIVLAISVAGMTFAFPVGIGLALIVGVIVNYISEPLANPYLLFGGVLFILLAMIIVSFAGKRTENTSRLKKIGVIAALSGGLFMGFFYRLVAISMSPDFYHIANSTLTPYSALFVFSWGVFFSNFLFNSYLMYRPISGIKCNYSMYLLNGSLKTHLVGISGGLIWSLGMLLSILSASEAGFAISYGLGQGATLVAAIWGVFIWKEYKGASQKVKILLFLMFSFYLIGLFCITFSR